MLSMHSFKIFLAEANSVGSGFEQKTADMIQEWLGKNGLSGKYKARRYQKLAEEGGSRDEDFSDVVVEEKKTGDRFFVECKEFERSNVLNLQFDIKPNGDLVPVKGNKREPLDENETGNASGLIKSIKECDGYSEFVDFLNTRNKYIKNLKPAEFWSDPENEDAGRFLPSLIKAYNKMVKNGDVEADCKPFDAKKLRDSTMNQLVCALCWRLSDPDRTWDICKVDSIPGLGRMIRRHYTDGKAEAAKYIQFGNDKLFRTSEDNPFGLKDVPVFPSELDGEFTLKFTPRFGTGSIYVTPRSEITSELDSGYSFIDKKKWPCVQTVSENLENPRLLNEDEEGKNINKAEKWIRDNVPDVIGQTVNGHHIGSARDMITRIREEIPSSRLPLAKDSTGKFIKKIRPNGQEICKGTCRWMLGVCRIYFSELSENGDNAVKNVSLLNDILKIIADRHEEDFRDNDLNGLTFQHLCDSFEKEVSSLKADERFRTQTSVGGLTRNDNYTIVKIDNFDDASKFLDYTGWCVTEDEDTFNQYTQDGTRRFYFCIRNDYKTVIEKKGQDYPKDEYGSSMLAILIDEDGSMNSSDGCTCRWNCGGRIYEPKEIQQLLGVDFYKTFKPYSVEELMSIYEKKRAPDDEISKALGGMRYQIGDEDPFEDDIEYTDFYVVNNNGKLIKYKKISDNCIVNRAGFFRLENGKIVEGAPSRVEDDFDCGHNQLSSLEGAPSEVEGDFYCDYNQLTSLKGVPPRVMGSFNCGHNQLSSLEGAPSKIWGYFCCSNNPNLSQRQIDDYVAFLKKPTPEHIDETEHYKP